jgi:hypothetical protein
MEKRKKLVTKMINITGDEIKNYKSGYQKYLSRKKELQYGLFDIGKFDRSVFTDDEIMERADDIANRLFGVNFGCVLNFPKPNSFRDVMIINRAIGVNCDYFLTTERKFVTSKKEYDNQKWFEEKFGIKVRYVEKEKNNSSLIEEISKLLN